MRRSPFLRGTARRLVAVLLVVCTTQALDTDSTPTAQAQVLQSGAGMSCNGTTMHVYPPGTGLLTKTNTPNSTIHAFTYIMGWTGTQWVEVADTGWWAFAMTNHRGYLSPVVVNYGASQASYAVTRVINSQLVWLQSADYAGAYRRTFNLAPGHYYAAVTWMYDYGDGTYTTVVHHTSASDPSTPYYCLA